MCEIERLARIFYEARFQNVNAIIVRIPTPVAEKKDVVRSKHETDYCNRILAECSDMLITWDDLSEGQKENYRYWAHRFYNTTPWPYTDEI